MSNPLSLNIQRQQKRKKKKHFPLLFLLTETCCCYQHFPILTSKHNVFQLYLKIDETFDNPVCIGTVFSRSPTTPTTAAYFTSRHIK
ncbi:CLUMA_CG012785, isoform A [Clunio marinus]|uniref:CLUMA_CG012785, isoform A n=1 Tax=Clunio marinus TaxID=568069 RepID=A0A1J1IGB6_9DIPT|nr:CLUMA_CG012785, isoform A [Clunio marinus]